MHRYWPSYIFFGVCFLLITSCRQAKNVSKDSYLLQKNEVEFRVEKGDSYDTVSKHKILDVGEMEEFVRPTVNSKVRLWVYNRIDTAKHAKQVKKKEDKFGRKNMKKAKKERKINDKRIAKAKKKGKSEFKPKVVKRKSTKYGWRDWIREKWGEAPVELDTARTRKSGEQLEIYLKKRGFRYGSVRDTIIYDEKKRKAVASYLVSPGQPYVITEVRFDSLYRNRTFMLLYDRMTGEEGHLIQVGDVLDEDILDEERNRFAQYCRNNALYGFNRKYINYEVDTITPGNHGAIVKFLVKQKQIPNPRDSTKMAVLPHRLYKIKDVTFRLHNPDTASFQDNWGDFVNRCKLRGLEPFDTVTNQFPLLDTIRLYRKGTFIFNYKPFLNPKLLDDQNFLEITHPDPKNHDSIKYYKEYYIERSYRTMNKLDVFESISIDVQIDPEHPVADSVVVFYDLVPAKRQSFLIEPRTTNTNGVLGLTGSITYLNKNCFRGAQRLETSFVGGIEAQPAVFGTNDTNQRFIDRINTFEIGPTLSLSFPKLVPLGKRLQDRLSKRLYPSTEYRSAVNIQQRQEFLRVKGGFAYNWAFKEGKTREWKITLVDLNFVFLDKKPEFEQSLAELNDPFLINSYSNHLTSAFAINWHFNNLKSNRRIKRQSPHIHDIDIKAMESGALLYWWKVGSKTPDANGLRAINNVPYTTFVKFDVQYIINQKVNRSSSLAYRFFVGTGHAFKNLNSPSLPYEYSFFAGGSNDIRAFPAKTMAPGNTQRYIDTTASLTQIGDMRLEVNLEYRFKITSLFEGAVFVDAGNVWLIQDKTSTNPGAFRWNNFYEGVALGAGVGLRVDLDFLVVRLDAAVPIYNPYLPNPKATNPTDPLAVNERWIFNQNKPVYLQQISDLNVVNFWNSVNPHKINFSFGIGYPF